MLKTILLAGYFSFIFLSHSQNQMVFFDADKGYGYIDSSGQILIQPKYEEVYEFSHGFAGVKLNNKWGFINSIGMEVIPFQYDFISESFSTFGYARVGLFDYGYIYIDTNGNECAFTRIYDIYNDCAWVDLKGGMGIVHLKTREEIYKCTNCDGSDLKFTSNGLMWLEFPENKYVSINGKEYFQGESDNPTSKSYITDYRNYNGKFCFYKYTLSDQYKDLYSRESLPQIYDTIYQVASYDDFGEKLSYISNDGFRFVGIGDKKGIIDSLGKRVTPVKYDWIDNLFWGEGFAHVGLNSKKGIIDKTGKEVLAPEYFNVGKFSEGLAFVQSQEGGNFGYINTRGELVLDFILEYLNVGDFSEGLASVESKDFTLDAVGNLYPKYGFIDKSGREIIPPKFSFVENFKNGKAKVTLTTLNENSEAENRDLYIDKGGNEIKQ